MRIGMVSSQSPSGPPPLTAYPLDDNGTLAAAFGFGWMETNAPAYLQADYAYTGAATGGTVLGLPAASTAFSTQAIAVPAGMILACEFECISQTATAFANVGMAAFHSIGGTPTGAVWTGVIDNTTGSQAHWSGTGVTQQNRTSPTAGFRIGLEIDGDGTVTIMTTDGSMTSSATFTPSPGNCFTFYIFAVDAGNPTAGNDVSVRLVPAAADMVLSYSPGAVDVFGDPIA